MTVIDLDTAPADTSGGRPAVGLPRRRRLVAAGVLATVLLVGAGVTLWLRPGVEEGLPGPSNPTAAFTLAAMKAGKTDFSLGTLHLQHPGKEVQIVAVKPLTSPNIEYLGAIAIWPRDLAKDGASTGGPGFPEKRTKAYHPIEAVVPATETGFVPPEWNSTDPPPVAVTAGFRLTSGKIGAVNGVRVVYTVDGEKKSEMFRHAVIACLGPKPCRGPDEPHFEDNALRKLGLFAEE